MGYVHDTSMARVIPCTLFHCVTGTWAEAAGVVAHTAVKKASLGANTATVTIPILLPQNSKALKGSYLKSIDIWWEVTGAALDALDAVLYKATLPANGAAVAAPTSLAFSYDTGHDTAAERLTLDQHKMTLTPTTPFWVDDDDLVTVELTVDGATNSVVELLAARANYTARL